MPRKPPTLLALLSLLLCRPAGAATERPRDLLAPTLGGTRTVTVFLPPGYEDLPTRAWPLLIAFDGQDMAAWRLAEALERHHAAGGDTPVVAAISAGPGRLADYGTAGVLNAQSHGARAVEFQAWITDTVLPWLHRRYRLRQDPAHTAVMGASLGGLAAFDLAWRRPDVFGTAGVFSGSFWWRTGDASAAEQQATRIAHRRVRDTAAKPALRLWFQAGTADETADRDGNGVIDAIQDTTELIDELGARGFRRGTDVVYREIPGGGHNPATWARALPEFLRWAFPGKTNSPRKHP
jgi:enterochelin esterase-like enzyme